MNREKLVTKNENVYTESGKFMFSGPMTDRAKELLDDKGWGWWTLLKIAITFT